MKVEIEIDCEFGSDFQRIVARDTLMILLRAWKTHTQTVHQKNRAFIAINGDNIENLDFFNWIDED